MNPAARKLVVGAVTSLFVCAPAICGAQTYPTDPYGGYGQAPGGYGQDQGGYGQNPGSYTPGPGSSGQAPGGYGQPQGGYGQPQGGYIQGPGGYGAPPPDASSTTVYGGPANPDQPPPPPPPLYNSGGRSMPPPYAQAPGYGAPPSPPPPPPAYDPAAAPAAQAQSGPNLTEALQAAGQFRTFLQIADVAGYIDALNRGGPYTVFAPTDAAFTRLPPGTVANMLRNQAFVISFVRFHMVPGQIRTADMARPSQPLQTLQGNVLDIGTRGGQITVNGAAIVLPDHPASNGMIQGLAAFALPVYPSYGPGAGQTAPGGGRGMNPVPNPTPSRGGSSPYRY